MKREEKLSIILWVKGMRRNKSTERDCVHDKRCRMKT